MEYTKQEKIINITNNKIENMNEFKKELTDLINKHGLESKYNDTPDYILANIAIDAMQSFARNTCDRDRFHGFANADKTKEIDEKSNKSFRNNRVPGEVLTIANLIHDITGMNVLVTRVGNSSKNTSKKKHKHNHHKFDDMGCIMKKGSKGSKFRQKIK